MLKYNCSPSNSSSSGQRGRKKKKSKKSISKHFGALWKQAREDAGLTQAEVAEALGYTSGQFISNVESGRCRFPGNQLGKIKKLYSLKTGDLLQMVLEEEEQVIRQALKME